MTKKLYLGLVALILILISVSVVLLIRTLTSPSTFVYQDQLLLQFKAPPPGETFVTGHWHGDNWHRIAATGPPKVSVDGEQLSYEELKSKLSGAWWHDTYSYGMRVIEAYPYSEAALEVRYKLAKHDENFQDVSDSSILLSRYKEMLKYHWDSPRLLSDITKLLVRMEGAPSEVIKYGRAALVYIQFYPTDSWYYGAWTSPEEIHSVLGSAYQKLGAYETALVHFKAAKKLVEANPGRRWKTAPDWLDDGIRRIEEGGLNYAPAEPQFDYIDMSRYDLPNISID